MTLEQSLFRLLRWSLLLFVCALATPIAQAQRRSMLIVELIDVPINLATPAKPSREQVRDTIIAAALASEWDVDPQADGSLRLSMIREFDSRVVVDVQYTDSTYSIRYVSSENLNYSEKGELRPMSVPLERHMAEWRSTKSAKQPEFKYAVDKVGIIHPAYEGYVYELSAGIRRHLRWALR